MQSINITKLRETITLFARERNWEQYHVPKNIAMALSVEASELVEIFQWLTAEESIHLKDDPAKLKKVKDEIADIFVYLVRMIDLYDIDLEKAVASKMVENAKKYPVAKAKGNAKKYDEY